MIRDKFPIKNVEDRSNFLCEACNILLEGPIVDRKEAEIIARKCHKVGEMQRANGICSPPLFSPAWLLSRRYAPG